MVSGRKKLPGMAKLAIKDRGKDPTRRGGGNCVKVRSGAGEGVNQRRFTRGKIGTVGLERLRKRGGGESYRRLIRGRTFPRKRGIDIWGRNIAEGETILRGGGGRGKAPKRLTRKSIRGARV